MDIFVLDDDAPRKEKKAIIKELKDIRDAVVPTYEGMQRARAILRPFEGVEGHDAEDICFEAKLTISRYWSKQ